MKHRVAVFKSIKYGNPIATSSDMCAGMYSEDYVRLTDWIEVEFSELSNEAVINAQLCALDALEDKVKLECANKLNDITQRKAELLALPGPVTDEPDDSRGVDM
jgi:hypothetical protein